MNTPYIVTLKRQNRSHRWIWNGKTPFKLGEFNPQSGGYVLESVKSLASGQSGVRVRDLTQTTGIRNQASVVLSSEQLKGGYVCRLKDMEVEIKGTSALRPAYLSNASDKQSEASVPYAYMYIGDWIADTHKIGNSFTGHDEDNKYFTIQPSSDGQTSKMMSIRLLHPSAQFTSVIHKSKRDLEVNLSDLSNVEIKTGSLTWKFGTSSAKALMIDPSDDAKLSPEDQDYRRKLGASLSLLLLLFIMMPFVEIMNPEEEKTADAEVVPPQYAKFVYKAAPRARQEDAATAGGPKSAQNNPAPATGGLRGAGNPNAPQRLIGKTKVLENMIQRLVNDGISSNMSAANRPGKGASDQGEWMGRLAKSTGPGGPGRGNLAVGSIAVNGTGGGNGLNGVGYGTGDRAKVSGQGKGYVRGLGEEPYVDEGLLKEEVAAVFQKHRNEIRYCHSAATIRDPGLEAKIGLVFQVNLQGRVVGAGTDPSSTPAKDLQNCLISRLITWEFPKPKGKNSVKVAYPLNFTYVGKGET